MAVNTSVEIAIAAIALAAIIFVPAVRALIGFSIAVAAIAVAIGGTAVLMNNVSIYESPGPSARIRRFLTVDWAATSEKGSGSAECIHGWRGGPAPGTAAGLASLAPKPRPPIEPRAKAKGKSERRASAETEAPSAAMPVPTAATAEEEDLYPELARHGYPGISRGKLLEIAGSTVNQLGGWQVVDSDRRGYTIDCVYTTRLLRFEDELRIVVTPSGEVDLCSRSRAGAPGSGSWLGIFPGDLGANIGHIKEFYEALEPKVDAVYKEQERRMNPGRP